MKITSRRFWPLCLALVCWLLVLVVPPTRQQLLSGWNNNFAGFEVDDDSELFSAPQMQNPNADELLKSYPQNEDIDIYAAQEKKDALQRLEHNPNNVPLLVLTLQQQAAKLQTDRFEGPLSNPNYPKPYAPTPVPTVAPPPITSSPGSPIAPLPPPPPISDVKAEKSSPEEWNRFIALARRGQKLEPSNTYFDWLLLYALYATRQDELARTTLAKAALKIAYDDHSRDLTLIRLAILRLNSNKPLSPREQNFVWYSGDFVQYGKYRQASRWVMEGVIADRLSGNHNRALNSAVDLMKICRLVRRESYTLIGTLVGTACEAISLAQVTMPPATRTFTRKPQFGSALRKFQSHPRMLYSYANSQKRSDITQLLSKEWVDAGKWRKLDTVIINQEWTGNTQTQTLAIIAAERFTGLVLKALPSILVLGLLCALLSLRFHDATAARGALSRGVWFGLALWIYALMCDAICALSMSDNSGLYDPENKYTYGGGLLGTVPSWVVYGLAGATICLGLNQAVLWQKEQAGRRIKLRTRFKTILDAPEDGLARFDFGWILGLALQLSIWLIFLGGLLLFCFEYHDIRQAFSDYINPGLLLMQIMLLISALLSLRTWRRLPHRHEAFLLSFRMAGGALAGFFVATSVLYALVAMITLPISLRFEDNFTKAMQRGEVLVARAKLGL